LADKITQLEESVVKKFMHAAKVQMLDAQTVRANLLTHGVRPEIIELAIDEYLR
jgi:hypothetical protein